MIHKGTVPNCTDDIESKIESTYDSSLWNLK